MMSESVQRSLDSHPATPQCFHPPEQQSLMLSHDSHQEGRLRRLLQASLSLGEACPRGRRWQHTAKALSGSVKGWKGHYHIKGMGANLKGSQGQSERQ